ncbi:A disintegrin and metalloproteinase with thrombospondin motifs 3-like [Mytilus trossulus]|uniref:A disintegrin and metalloproteinase with thrombospondin motifs 3-like n=1 Tax=Mytilus trossulus TaxID=6551 RepID=UPI0030053A61
MNTIGITLALFQSLSILCICMGSLRSVCLEEEQSVIIPYISNRNGQFVSDLNNSTSYQYLYISFKWKNGLHTLQLQKSVQSLSNIHLTWDDGNETLSSSFQDECSYQGNVVGKAGSVAAVSVCDNLNGYVLTTGYEFVIENLDDDYHKTGLHKLTACRVKDFNFIQMRTNNRSRHRRDASDSKKYLEVLLAVDPSVVKFIGKEKVESYVLTIMNIVNRVYKHDTLETDIEVVTTNIFLMTDTDVKAVYVKNDARLTVDRFCAYMASHPRYAVGSKHDISVMITRNAIGPAGYAPITGMCNPARSCALIKDEGFTSAFIVAHEIAHVIGVYHDGHGNDCGGREFQYSMMASMVQSTLHHYWWSRCSNDRIKQALPYLTCMNNNPLEDPLKGVSHPLGKAFNLDDQCRYEFGANHISCRSYYGDLCDTLWCAEKSNMRLCKTKRGRPLNGTPCSSGKYWCMDGKCSYHGHNKPRDGKWGDWGSWTSCSTDCEVGIKERSRRCNNPRPAFGGKPCEGDDKEVYTCSTGKECKEYSDLRALQCSALNGIPIRGRAHTWLAYQKEKEKDQCKFTCQSNDTGQTRSFEDMDLEDGTPCTYENPNNICVKGECWKVGCDGQMNSTETYDDCGVCGGNGSDCKLVKGTYERMFSYERWPPKYERILVIPANSRKIVITEGQSASHFFAVRDPAYGIYYLNGNRRLATRSKKIVMNGAWFEYENQYNRESLKSVGPLRRPLELMMMPQNKYQKASVNYEYVVKKDDFTFEKSKYEWVYDHWTDCSVTCGDGSQHIINKCIDKDTKESVIDNRCLYVGSKTDEPVKCERKPCDAETYVWAMQLTWTQCSVSCGGGIQTQEYTCENKTPAGAFIQVDVSYCDNTSSPNYTQPCNKKQCGFYEWESTDQWTACPITCGFEGWQFEIFNCSYVMGEEREVANASLCGVNLKPNITRACRLEPCYQQWYQWGFNNEYTECSATCGGSGIQFPVFFCEQIDSRGFSDIVSLKMCNNMIRPENSTKPCKQDKCVFEWFEWHYEEWSECSVPCGNTGYQTRDYHCKRMYSNGTSETEKIYMCDDLQRPVYKKDCSGPPCKYSIFRLKYSEKWEECTATCGDMGIQTQKSFCHEVMPNGTINDVSIHMCADLVSLSEIQACNRIPCIKYKWTASPYWTNCTAVCGDDGLTYQMHYCDMVKEDGSTQFVHFEFCADIQMPFVSKECNRRECDQEWIAGNWSKCSTTCDKGVQRRPVICGEPENTNDDFLCLGDPPSSIQACKLEACPLDDATCIDKRSFCGRMASRRRCAYRGYKDRCCASCSKWH